MRVLRGVAGSAIAAFAALALGSVFLTPGVYAKGTGGHSGGGHSSGSHASGSHSGGSSSTGSRVGSGHSTTSPKNTTAKSGQHRSTYATGVQRDSHGRIERSERAKHDFQKGHPCPSTGKTSGACPGYVIDHVKPLKRGGQDAPSNMQWQTTQAAKDKDRTE
jgi:hypothetical protein